MGFIRGNNLDIYGTSFIIVYKLTKIIKHTSGVEQLPQEHRNQKLQSRDDLFVQPLNCPIRNTAPIHEKSSNQNYLPICKKTLPNFLFFRLLSKS